MNGETVGRQIHVNPDKWRRLKALLAARGETLSSWAREQIDEELRGEAKRPSPFFVPEKGGNGEPA